MDDQPDNTLSFINKCIKSESSDHIVHHHTNVTICAQQHIEKASVVIDSEFSNSTTVKCHINIDTIKTETAPAKDKAYLCSKCCESFETSHNFWQHMLTHADKKHACPHCEL